MRIKLTKKVHKILDEHFKNAPKTYEESVKAGRFIPFPKGKKYKDYENEHRIIVELLEAHTNQNCSCKNGEICLFKKYENEEITIEKLLSY
ncbi:MAG TPA: hypothetical protein PL084_05910 [Chitinophagales bacterium]|nr:hypothetical protein [Chitinophagales bacterium]HRP40121.1 hypothetical protein [Chitinophagales bacterium]